MKQERDQILLSLKQNPHVEGINVTRFGSANPGTLCTQKKETGSFRKQIKIKNGSPLLSIKTLKFDTASWTVEIFPSPLKNTSKVALPTVAELNKNRRI